jgi:KUP system potassium uptake protein
LLIESLRNDDPELLPFISALAGDEIHRVSRTAVYAVANPDTVPQALMHNLKHNQVLHERNLILTVAFHDVPWIAFEERVQITPLVTGFWRVQVNYGFKNTPDIPKALELCRAQGLPINLFETSYFLSRETVVPTRGAGMARSLLCPDVTQRRQRRGVLPLAKQLRDRARNPRSNLIANVLVTDK